MFPELTHLQFYILSILMDGHKSGRDVRNKLVSEHGIRKTLAAFYQLMARLEKAGVIKGWYETKHKNGITIKERRYEILGPGIRMLEEQIAFYTQENVSLDLSGGLT